MVSARSSSSAENNIKIDKLSIIVSHLLKKTWRPRITLYLLKEDNKGNEEEEDDDWHEDDDDDDDDDDDENDENDENDGNNEAVGPCVV